MAFMTADGEGPFPNRAGEHCGNFFVDCYPVTAENETLEDALKRQDKYLSRFRFGRPRPTSTGTIEELEKLGLNGLYLKEDQSIGSSDTEIKTPDWLKEPGTYRD